MVNNTNFPHDLDIKIETYHLDQCDEILGLVNYATVCEGHSCQAGQKCTQNSARGIKTWCLKLDHM